MNSSPSEMNKPRLLVLVGPTAVGKTKLSLELAEAYQCEIISGDSMQIYRGMDIGTAKASAEEQARIPHHMIDIHEPSHPFSVSEFQERVHLHIDDIHSRNKLPFIVGGTGLYIESVCYDFQFSETNADEDFREEHRLIAESQGSEVLHKRLQEVDPLAAERIHPNDQRRIIRALEVVHLTGKVPDRQLRREEKTSPYQLCIIGLTMDRAKLYERINERVDLMMAEGLVDEVKGLMEQGYTPDMVSMQGLGYKEMVSYHLGELSLEEAVYILKQRTRRFAKRQLSWFRHMKNLNWVDLIDDTNISIHFKQINDIIAGKLGLHLE